jgi:hypothetical protein
MRPFNLVKPAFAQIKSWSSINSKCVYEGDVATIQGFECVFYNILQIIMYIAGLVFFAMLINGGFKYIFASGDPKKMASASSTLSLSIVGIIGVIASYFIIQLIAHFTGINDIKTLNIPG